MAAASVPWRTEALAYASDLGDRLPDGLSMPRALGVFDLDELSAAIWLEEVDRPAVAVGPRALPAGGVPPRPDGRQPPGRAAGQRGRVRLVGARLRLRAARRCRCCRSCAARRSGSTRRSRRPSTPSCATACAPPPTRCDKWLDELDEFPLADQPRRLQPEQPAPGAEPRQLHPDRLRLLGAEPDRLRPRPAPRRRRAARPPLAVAARRDRGGHRRRRTSRAWPTRAWPWTRPIVRRSHALLLMIFTGFSALPFEQLESTPPDAMPALARTGPSWRGSASTWWRRRNPPDRRSGQVS